MVKDAFHTFISDKHGHIVIWQKPNLPIISWFAFMIASRLLGADDLRSGVEAVSTAFLFTWAYLEIVQGVSPFRRVLGGMILSVVVSGFLL